MAAENAPLKPGGQLAVVTFHSDRRSHGSKTLFDRRAVAKGEMRPFCARNRRARRHSLNLKRKAIRPDAQRALMKTRAAGRAKAAGRCSTHRLRLTGSIDGKGAGMLG